MKFRPKTVDYGGFVNSIFSSLQQDEKHELFYRSLFDPSGWEELGELQRFLDFSKIEGEIIELIKIKNRTFFKKFISSDRKKEHFLASFIHNGNLCNFMLATALREKQVEIPFASVGQSFPDLPINVRGEPKKGIEIKRLVGCSNLKERINDEIIPQLFRHKEIDKLLLLLVFPVLKIDYPFRVHQLTGGYYVYEDYIQSKIQRKLDIRVLCRCVEEEYFKDSEYSFESLIEFLSRSI